MAQLTPADDERRVSISFVDKSNYYRGLLVLARRDQTIEPRERELILQFGKILDFDWRFCEAAIDDVLKNRHVTEEPVTFADRETAERFLRDGIRLALVDEKIERREFSWLRAVAQANGLTEEWLDTEIHRFRENGGSLGPADELAIQELL
jgi:hypothetical protein